MNILLESIESGLIFSILALGIMISFKILDIADLSVEGTFPLGAFVLAKILTSGLNPIVGMISASLAGGLAGFLTYVIYKKIKVDAILAGILTMTILITVNLRIMNTNNVPLLKEKSIFDLPVPKIVILILIVLIAKILLDLFLKTEKGYLLLVTGDNESLVKALGKNPDKYTMLGLVLSNALIGLAGSLQGQYAGFADSTMGQTMIVQGLASIIIGDTIMKSSGKLKRTTRAIIGTLIYRIIYGLAIDYGVNPQDLKGITAIIVIVFIIYNNSLARGGKFLKGLKRNKEIENAWN